MKFVSEDMKDRRNSYSVVTSHQERGLIKIGRIVEVDEEATTQDAIPDLLVPFSIQLHVFILLLVCSFVAKSL